MSRPETELGWAAQGQARLEELVEGLGDLTAPSRLPDWTCGHVVTHLARNADALLRLLSWARTGVETPMYPSPEVRNAEIEAGAGRPHGEQLDDLRATGARFGEQADALEPADWEAGVRTAQGLPVPASAVAWMRVREVWLHQVDLGAEIDVLPPDVAVALVRDVAGSLADRVDTSVTVTLPDGEPVTFGSGGRQVDVSGAPAELAGWLTGRSPGSRLRSSDGLPELPRWL